MTCSEEPLAVAIEKPRLMTLNSHQTDRGLRRCGMLQPASIGAAPGLTAQPQRQPQRQLHGQLRVYQSHILMLMLMLLLLLLMLPGIAQAAIKLNITGLPDELEDNIKLSVGQPTSDSDRALKRYVDSLPEQASRALAALGYYSARIKVSTRQGDDGPLVTIAVEPGDPVLINRVVLRIDGPAQLDGQYMPVLGNIPLRKGAIFNSADYESTKSVLLDRAQETGYFDFRFTTNAVRVSRSQLSADIDLIADSGLRYTFGQILFDQDIFSQRFLNRWLPFTEGDPYAADKIGELTQNLQNSGYFKSVRVLPQRDRRYGTTVPVQVVLERKDNNQVGIGLGFATDTGPRTKLTWGIPRINRYGHSADAELGLSEVSQDVSFAYRIPRDNQPLYNYWGIEYGLRNAEKDGVESFLSTLNFQRVRRLSSLWTESVFIRWERERSTLSSVESTTDLILPGISYSRNRSKGSPFTTWGQATSFQFLYGSRKLLSTIDFYKSVVNFKYLRAVSERNTLIASLQYGAISTNDFNRVPASQRFFAGGDRSIRGFGYRDVSPRDLDDEPVGGRYLEVTSLEYSYRFRDRWSVALFADGGRHSTVLIRPTVWALALVFAGYRRSGLFELIWPRR